MQRSLEERANDHWERQSQVAIGSVEDRTRVNYFLNRRLERERGFPIGGDNCNNAVDPFTLEVIPEGNLVTYVDSNGERYCFDIYSLYGNWKHAGKLTNPFTGERLPTFVVAWLEVLYKPVIVRVITEDFHELNFAVDPLIDSVADEILHVISLPSGSLFDNLVTYDIFNLEGKSLYDTDMGELVRNVPITYVSLTEFKSEERMRRCMLKLRNYLTRSSGTIAVKVVAYLKDEL